MTVKWATRIKSKHSPPGLRANHGLLKFWLTFIVFREDDAQPGCTNLDGAGHLDGAGL
jgi:hypothetical protein